MMGFLHEGEGESRADWFPKEQRSITLADFPQAARLLDMSMNAGVLVNERTALNLSAYFNGVDIISGQIGLMPLLVYRRVDEDNRERATSLPAYKLLHDQPNDFMTAIVFWQTIMAHILTWGNGYAEIEWDRAGRPIGLWPIDPSRIEPHVENNVLRYVYSGKEIAPSDVLHIPGLGFDGVRGYSPIRMAQRSLGAAMATEQFGASFFGNGAFPGMVLEHPGTLSQGAAERLAAGWNQTLQGPYKAQRTKVLEEGMKANKIGIPPEDAQFLETREFGVVEVARWLNIPPHKLKHKVGERPGGNIEASQIDFLTDTLQPWLVRIEQECNRKLLPAGDTYYAEHLAESILRLQAKDKADVYWIYYSMGVLDADSIARKENLPKPKPPALPLPVKPAPPKVSPANPAPGEPPVAEPPPPADPKARAAFRALIVDVAERFIVREADRARRASKKGPDAFGAWVDSFYAAEVDSLAARLSPVVGITTLSRGLSESQIEAAAKGIAAGHVEKSREELLDLRKDDLEGQVERLTKRWEKTRPLEMADRIAALDAAEGEGNAA